MNIFSFLCSSAFELTAPIDLADFGWREADSFVTDAPDIASPMNKLAPIAICTKIVEEILCLFVCLGGVHAKESTCDCHHAIGEAEDASHGGRGICLSLVDGLLEEIEDSINEGKSDSFVGASPSEEIAIKLGEARSVRVEFAHCSLTIS